MLGKFDVLLLNMQTDKHHLQYDNYVEQKERKAPEQRCFDELGEVLINQKCFFNSLYCKFCCVSFLFLGKCWTDGKRKQQCSPQFMLTELPDKVVF